MGLFSVAEEKVCAFLLIFQKLGGVTASEKLEYTEKKISHREEVLLTALCLFFAPPSSSSVFGKLSCLRSAREEALFLSILANLFTS